jgi:hypothetical protein
VLVGPYALKLPRVRYGWRLFLLGLLGNMSEQRFGTAGLEGVCPVVFAIPGGFLIVQRRARLMTEAEFRMFDPFGFCNRSTYHIPAEMKPDSFGWLNDRGRDVVVVVDYAGKERG